MTENHPITPSPELVQQWAQLPDDWNTVAFHIAQWGADQELEACCEWLNGGSKIDYDTAALLRAHRRPHPPRLKEQALALIDDCTDPEGDYLDDNALSIIRRALEQLDD